MDSDDGQVPRFFEPEHHSIRGRAPTLSQLVAYNASTAKFRQALYNTRRDLYNFQTRTNTVVISFDGACRSNGYPNAQGAYGVYFGPGSPHNENGLLPSDSPKTSQFAELYAANRAVKKAIRVFCSGLQRNHVILMTDSAYLVNSMTDYIDTWKNNGWLNSRNRPVVHRDTFMLLDELITGMEDGGRLVEFWKVPREWNTEADQLANDALDYYDNSDD